MAKLNKSENGLIFYDDFKEQTLLWTLSPSDANNLRFGDNGLTMLHHNRYTTFTITEPESEEYSCIVELDHIPRDVNDIGGIIVIANNKEYAECQSFLATDTSELTNSNITKEDIKQVIKTLLDDSYVRYTLDDMELNDLYNGSSIESSGENIDKEHTEEQEPFADVLYKFIKFTKRKNKYIFSASEDGMHWINVGNVCFENAGAIGFFIYGTTDENVIQNSHFNIKSMAIYSSMYLMVNSVPKEYEFEIVDGEGRILLRTDSIPYFHMINRSDNSCSINTATLPMPIKDAHIRLYPKNDYDTTIVCYELGNNTYGGDIFNLELNLKAIIDDKEISPTELFDLGTLGRGSQYVLMAIKNCEDYTVTNIKLHVVAYSEYYSGFEEIKLALPIDGVPRENFHYSKTVTIDKINSQDSKLIYMKFTDKMIDLFYHAANVYRFKIIIE